jgi:hypothetical protein
MGTGDMVQRPVDGAITGLPKELTRMTDDRRGPELESAHDSRCDGAEKRRRAYRPPTLTTIGSVRELTMKGGTKSDGPGRKRQGGI